MSNHVLSLLEQWHKDKASDWVLGTIYHTEGSAYRKAGAMMLINSEGQFYGMLSGGCLEADIVLNAMKVLAIKKARTMVYDSTDDQDISHQLGIGCGGKIKVLLQLVTDDNDLGLSDMLQALRQQRSGVYEQNLIANQGLFISDLAAISTQPYIDSRNGQQWLVTAIEPPPHILIIGGGRDVIPVCNLAKLLGWTITIADSRPANARHEYFPLADQLLDNLGDDLHLYIQQHKITAVIIMSHNLNMDVKGILACQYPHIKYIALLGPDHRYQQVMEKAAVSELELPCKVSAPAGFDLGGETPESIALAMLAECHAVIHNKFRVGQESHLIYEKQYRNQNTNSQPVRTLWG